MKLHFESNLDYQLAAIEAVCDLFRGQEICRSEFTVTMHGPSAPVVNDLFPGTTPLQMSLGVAESSARPVPHRYFSSYLTGWRRANGSARHASRCVKWRSVATTVTYPMVLA